MVQAMRANPKQIILLIILLVCAAGAVYSFSLGESLRFLPDEQDYVRIVSNLAEHGTFSIDGASRTAYRAPAYPWLLYLVSLIRGNMIAFRIVNFLLLAGTMYISFILLGREISPDAAWTSGVLTLGYPVIFFTAGALYPQTLAAFLLVLFIFLISGKQTAPGKFAAAGVVGGLLVLTIPLFMFVIVLAVVWTWFARRENFYRLAVLTLLPVVFLVGSWTVRNYLAFDALVFVTSNSGENLLVGNSANTTPNAGTTVDIGAARAEAEIMDEISRDRFFRDQALSYIRSNPGDALKLYVGKVFNYFNYSNELVTQSESSSLRDWIMLATYGPMLVVFVARLMFFWKYPPSALEWLLILIYLASALLYAVFFTRIRFRVPFDHLLIWLVVLFAERVIRTKTTRAVENG